MSYDIDVYGESRNYTSNMAQFFRDFNVYPPNWDGKNRDQVAAEISNGLADIYSWPMSILKLKYDAPNGWGDVASAITLLEDIHRFCTMKHDETVEVSW